MTPAAVTRALAQYVDFGPAQAALTPPSIPLQPAAPAPGNGLPRKGMLLPEVEAMLGEPATVKERKEGTLKVQTREYPTPNGRITGEFIEGVLFRYTVTSQ
jgi:hypothetical protein